MYKNLYDNYYKWYHTKGDTNDNNILIISDTHFNDEESKIFRGEKYPGDDEFVKLINSKVSKKDTLIILGDIGDLEYVKKLKGYKVLLLGNHDKGVSNYRRGIKQVKKLFVMPHNRELPYSLEEYDKSENIRIQVMKDYPNSTHVEERTVTVDNHLFDEVYEGPLMINDRLILSHEPIEHLPAYMFNIHGHDHSGWFKSSNHLNVCAEQISYTPVSLISLLKNGLLKNVESIHRLTIDNATERKNKRDHK